MSLFNSKMPIERATSADRLAPAAITVSSGPYTVVAGYSLFKVDATGGAITVNLPDAFTIGHQITVAKIDTSGNAVTLVGTIAWDEDYANYQLTTKGESLTLIPDGSSWRVAGWS